MDPVTGVFLDGVTTPSLTITKINDIDDPPSSISTTDTTPIVLVTLSSGEATGPPRVEIRDSGGLVQSKSLPSTIVRITDPPFTLSFPFVTPIGTGNTYTIEAFFDDADAALESTSTAFTYTIPGDPDSVPPTFPTFSADIPDEPAVGYLTNSQSIEFTFTVEDNVTDPVTNIQCSLDGGAFFSCSSPLTLNGLLEGDHTFAVKATDDAANSATTSDHNWTVDLTPPTVDILTITPARAEAHQEDIPSYKQGEVITIMATFNEPMFLGEPAPEISISGANALSVASMEPVPPIDTTFDFAFTVGAGNGYASIALSDGQDVAGNTVVGSIVATFLVDNTIPVSSIDDQSVSTSTPDTSVTFTFSGTDNFAPGNTPAAGTPDAALTFECELDGTPENCEDNASFTTEADGFTHTITYGNLADGPHTFNLRAEDEAVNKESTSSFEWTVDTENPTPVISSTESPGPSNADPVPVSVDFGEVETD